MSEGSRADLHDVAKLVRARRLIAATLDADRAIVGEVSREWIRSEVERRTTADRLPPEIRSHAAAGIAAAELAGGMSINTNRLPKLEPVVSAHILTGTILYGTRLYGSGTADPASGARYAEIGNDLIVAAMIVDTLGRVDRQCAFLPERQPTVDDAYLREIFGPQVVDHLHALRHHRACFLRVVESDDASGLVIPPPYANAIAAIEAGTLRLTARAAGDRIFKTLDAPKREEMRAKGIGPGASDDPFPERPYLASAFASATAALALPGIDVETVLLPIRDQLLESVEMVLRYGVPPERLVGRYGNAIRNFHVALPLHERFSPIVRRIARGESPTEIEGPYALGTLHLTGLEVVRYLNKVRRKGVGTGAGHSFLVAARAESMLGSFLTVPAIAGSDCHDVVEDGGFEVTGYDQTLELFAARFGAPLAALVAEVTDSITKSDGPAKAKTFAEQARISTLEDLYNVGQLDELRAAATDPGTPYSLAGAVIKIADTATTQEEGIRDPDLMAGPWRHSGARVKWDLDSKGAIVRPLLERFAAEVVTSRTEPSYSSRPGALALSLIDRLVEVIRDGCDTSDRYLVQNLTILAGEYALDDAERGEIIAIFLDPVPTRSVVEKRLNALLADARLDAKVRERGYPATFRLDATAGAVRDLERLLDYREAASWRASVRAQLGIDPPSRESFEEVVQLYEMRMGSTSPLA